jgi:hypothetical protein
MYRSYNETEKNDQLNPLDAVVFDQKPSSYIYFIELCISIIDENGVLILPNDPMFGCIDTSQLTRYNFLNVGIVLSHENSYLPRVKPQNKQTELVSLTIRYLHNLLLLMKESNDIELIICYSDVRVGELIDIILQQFPEDMTDIIFKRFVDHNVFLKYCYNTRKTDAICSVPTVFSYRPDKFTYFCTLHDFMYKSGKKADNISFCSMTKTHLLVNAMKWEDEQQMHTSMCVQ